VFSLGFYMALRGVGADILGFILLTFVPWFLFAVILLVDGKGRIILSGIQ
jgi:hypothetical protein